MIDEIFGPASWPSAFIAAVVVLVLFAVDFGNDRNADRDDARLDRLRETAIEACADRTESVQALSECIARTIKATGQKP